MTGPKYLTYSQAAKLFPSNPSPNAVWRWARKGIKTRGGGRLHLQHVRSGAKIYTTAAWCDEFIAKLAECDTDQLNAPKPKVKPPVETRSTKRRRQIEQAEAEYASL